MDWIEKYENTTKDYRLTKPKKVDTVTISLIYTEDNTLPILGETKNVDIKDMVNINYKLNESGILSKDELLELIINHKNTYNSFRIMQFNINSEDHEDFMYDDETDFSTQLNGVGNIKFENTLGIFDEYATVYIMFLRRTKNNQTLKHINLKKNRKTLRYVKRE